MSTPVDVDKTHVAAMDVDPMDITPTHVDSSGCCTTHVDPTDVVPVDITPTHVDSNGCRSNGCRCSVCPSKGKTPSALLTFVDAESVLPKKSHKLINSEQNKKGRKTIFMQVNAMVRSNGYHDPMYYLFKCKSSELSWEKRRSANGLS